MSIIFPIINIVGKLLASMLCIHPFSTHCTAFWTENSMKSISKINPAITESTECLIVKCVPPIID